MLDRLKLRHLRVFAEVARIGSVGKAADSLSVTQPAISKTLRELEETLNVPLFDRTRKGVDLTVHGKTFLRYTEASLTALRQGVESVSSNSTDGAQLVRMGALPTVSARLIPDAIRQFKTANERDVVRVTTGENKVLIDQLRLGELDIVVGRLGDPDGMLGLTFEHLYSEHVSLVVRKDHPLTKKPNFKLSMIADYTVLTPPDYAIIRPWVDRLFLLNEVPVLPNRVETISTAFGRRFTEEGDAVWIISNGVVAHDILAGTLVELPVDARATLGPVGLTTRVADPPTPVALALMEAIRKAGSQLRLSNPDRRV